MNVLLDTGILLRVVDRKDPQQPAIRDAIRRIKTSGDIAVTTLQNVSEFWNVCTRPNSARGGLGLTIEQTEKRLRLLERFVQVLPEPAGLYEGWRHLVLLHRVHGVQVHDAKLVAAMIIHGIKQILTSNGRDFLRFTEIVAVTP